MTWYLWLLIYTWYIIYLYINSTWLPLAKRHCTGNVVDAHKGWLISTYWIDIHGSSVIVKIETSAEGGWRLCVPWVAHEVHPTDWLIPRSTINSGTFSCFERTAWRSLELYFRQKLKGKKRGDFSTGLMYQLERLFFLNDTPYWWTYSLILSNYGIGII